MPRGRRAQTNLTIDEKIELTKALSNNYGLSLLKRRMN